ncbi:MAG: ABC transporter permease, partial [Gemmatimonadota bacterium]
MSSESPLPPRIAERLLSWCLPAGNRGQAILGDLHEDYVRRISSGARRLASDLWYWNQLWRTGLPFLMRRIGRRPLYRTLDGTTEDPAVSSRKGWSMSETASDVRFALRSFSRNPGLAVSATMILGIGIGAITLMFSILNTAVLQPLPYEDPQELIWLWGETETISQNSVSYLDLVDFRDGTDAFEALGGYVVFQQTQFLTGRDQAEQVTATLVTANLFSILGATPELGRSFLAEEEGADAPRVAILGHALWRRRFGGDPAVVGSVISLEDQPVEVVGIMPARFDFPSGSDLWLPIQPTQTYAQGRGNNNFYVVGRLRHGVSFEQAQAQLDVVSANIATAAPNLRAGWGGRMVSLHERFFGDTRAMLLILVGIVSLVPIVASANVASLFLARADARRTEMASRLAVGASRVRLVRQVLTESLLFAVGGGLVGLVLAFGGGQAFRALAPTAVPRLEGLGIDGTVLTFSLLASFLMVPLFGILPALRGTDLSISETLRTGGTRGLSRGRSTF